ncbi:MAG: DUF3307 domain-containing protein [Albidovulum sp.]
MIETLTALLFGHILADFVLQTSWIAANKRRLPALLLHGLIVLAATQAATGRFEAPELLVLTLAHIGIDFAKTRICPTGLTGYLADQAAHLISLVALALWSPDLYASGLWASQPEMPRAMAYVGGAILTIRAGGFAVGELMRDYQHAALPEGLPNGGRVIGMLERSVIFLLVMVGQPAGIGFLIAAKSILRFDTASQNQHASEYVIIGTLASFAWALAAAFATLWFATVLTPS